MSDTFTPEEVRQILDAFFETVGSVQYIGARYVPIFGRKDEDTWDWDNTAPYEPLTVVQYQGNSFISRQAVPTGTAITDTTYWLETGNYNAQIEAYRNTVLTFDGRISDLEDTVGGFDQRITDLDGEFNNLSTDVENLNDKFEEWPENLTVAQALNNIWESVEGEFSNAYREMAWRSTAWNCANVLFVGDSFGNEDGTYGVSKCWVHQVCEAMGANYIPLCEDGTGFVNNFGTGTTYLGRIQNFIDDPDNDPNDINYIIVSGGVNDYSADATTLYNAMVGFMDTVAMNFPNAITFMVPQIAGANIEKCYVASSTKNQWVFPASIMQLVYASKNYSRAVLITNVQYCLNMRTDNVMNADMVHPTQRGHDVIARTFINSLYGNDEISTYTTTDLYISLNADGTKYPLDNSAATIIKHPTFYEIGITVYTNNPYTDASDVPYVWIKNIIPSLTPEAFGTCFIYSASTSSTHVGYCDPHIDYKTYTVNQTEEPLLGIGFAVGARSALVGSTGFISTAHLTLPMVHGFVESV